MPGTLSFRTAVRDNFITLYTTDGDPSMRPNAERDRIVRSDGSVDYMHECVGDDSTLVLWKTKIGTFLADVVLDLPEARGKKKYMLSALPKHYALFVHKKGDRFNPRSDAYLWGCKSGHLFRSPAEFFLHAKWIALGCPKPDPSKKPDLDEELFGPTPGDELTDRCGCKYCAGTDQAYISKTYSNYSPQRRRVNGGGTRANREEPSGIVNVRFEGLRVAE